jgi:PAS domain S-box-containing protein
LTLRVLRNSEELFRSVAQTAHDAIISIDSSGDIIFWNRGAEKMFGYSADEILGKPLTLIIPERFRSAHREGLRRAVSTGRSKLSGRTIELVGLRRDGSEFPLELSLATWKSCDNIYFAAIIRDITERKRAWETKNRLATILDIALDAIIMIDEDQRIILFNKGAERIFGYSADEVIGKPIDILIPQRFIQVHRQHVKKFAQSDETSRLMGSRPEIFARRKDGTEFPAEATISKMVQDDKIILTVILRDISERKSAEEALRDAYKQKEQLLKSITSILIGISYEDKVTHWNKTAERTFGKMAGEVIGRPFLECGIEWDWAEITKGIWTCREKGQAIQLRDVKFRRPDGSNGFLNITITPFAGEDPMRSGLLIWGEDITELKMLEAELNQAQKLQSIGQLAAGIAHEINTPIQYVGDNTRFLQESFSSIFEILKKFKALLDSAKRGDLSREQVEELERVYRELDIEYLLSEIPDAISQSLEGVARVAKIVQAMKEFSHPGVEEKTAIDINKAIESTITVSRNEWKYVADIKTDFDPNLPLVPVLPGEFNQAILNIIINAAHAIADVVGDGSKGKGTIAISTRRDGDWVEIRISDTGTGIPEEIRSRIFEPFFTTKEVGRGTGQGLTIAHNIIVRKHNGRISFETEVGKGTTFIIRLPIKQD